MKIILALITMTSSHAMAMTTEVRCHQSDRSHGIQLRISTPSPSDWLAIADLERDTGFGVKKLTPTYRVYRAPFPTASGQVLTYNDGNDQRFELSITVSQVMGDRAYGSGSLKAVTTEEGEIDIPVRCDLTRNEVVFDP